MICIYLICTFRSPFGDPNLSLSPIPKVKLFTEDDGSLPSETENKDAVRNLKFETTENFDSDPDETALDSNSKNDMQVSHS